MQIGLLFMLTFFAALWNWLSLGKSLRDSMSSFLTLVMRTTPEGKFRQLYTMPNVAPSVVNNNVDVLGAMNILRRNIQTQKWVSQNTYKCNMTVLSPSVLTGWLYQERSFTLLNWNL